MSPCPFPLQIATAHILCKVLDHVILYGMAPFSLLPFRQAAMICRMRTEFCSFVFRQRRCISPHPNPPEERLDSLMGFWLFTETMCHCEEGCKVNLNVFEVRVAPHWLSLSSLITLFVSSRSRSLTPRISCTLTHTYLGFELKLSEVSLCISFLLCPSLICVKRLRWLWGIGQGGEGVKFMPNNFCRGDWVQNFEFSP